MKRERPVGTGRDGTPAGGVWLRLTVCVLAIGTILVVVLGRDMGYSSWIVKGIQRPTTFISVSRCWY